MLVRLLTAAALAAGLLCAQGRGDDTMGGGISGGGMGGRGGGGGMGGDMMGGGGGPRPQQRQTKAELLGEKLKLKNDQKTDVEKILVDANQKASGVRGQLMQKRGEIAQAMAQRAPDDQV